MLNYLNLILTCGIMSTASSDIPVNKLDANSAQIDQHPYHATVIQASGEKMCSGTIINNREVLTVAHCIHGRNVSTLLVLVGADTFNSLAHSIWYPIIKTSCHPRYRTKSPGNSDYDFAIILIRGFLEFSEKVKAIPLAKETACEGTSATITSWKWSVNDASILQRGNLPIMSSTKCDKMYSKIHVSISKNMFCAAGSKNFCQIDDGAPVVDNGRLIGMVSWGGLCNKLDLPNIMYDIYKIRHWIRNTAKKLLGKRRQS